MMTHDAQDRPGDPALPAGLSPSVEPPSSVSPPDGASIPIADPTLPAPLRVGVTLFTEGVRLSTVQGCIDRMYARLRSLEPPVSEHSPWVQAIRHAQGIVTRRAETPSAAPGAKREGESQ